MNEFVCPNGRMSVNGVCPIFEGDDGQTKDFTKAPERKTGFFKFDFEEDTESKNEKADNILNKNINYYRNYVENNLGIPASVQSGFTAASIGYGIATGGGLAAIAGPLAIPFVVGGALRSKEENRIRNITAQDPQGDVVTYPTKIMNIQPTNRDTYMGGGGAFDGASSRAEYDANPTGFSGSF